MRKALTVAASDSGGACGIQADIKTFSALGVFATSVITSVTAQNSVEMAETLDLPTEMVISQARMVMQDIQPEAVKVGMIGRATNYEALANVFREYPPQYLVVDPVVTCYRGCSWVLSDEAIDQMIRYMLPLVDVFVPSIPDAEVILRTSICNLDQMKQAVRQLKEFGPKWVVLKGGHLDGDPIDVIWNGSELIELPGHRINTENDNGSGCTFSSAIAALLTRGLDVPEAVRQAKAYMQGALKAGFPVGRGKGPVHHFHHVSIQPAEPYALEA